MQVYFISGLGIDSRVFQKLQLPVACTVRYIDWIPPLHKEPISQYAQRMAQFIDQKEPFVLIGLSFGGMIATEMVPFVKPVKTIIISSAAHAGELPFYFKWASFLQLHQLIPMRLLKQPNVLAHWLFGVGKEEKLLLRQMMKDADNDILKWSIDAVLTWKQKKLSSDIVHIHGNKDITLPIRFTKPDIIIKGGSHLMVYSRAEEVSELLISIIKSIK